MALLRGSKAPFFPSWGCCLSIQVVDMAASTSAPFFVARRQEKCRPPFSGADRRRANEGDILRQPLPRSRQSANAHGRNAGPLPLPKSSRSGREIQGIKSPPPAMPRPKNIASTGELIGPVQSCRDSVTPIRTRRGDHTNPKRKRASGLLSLLIRTVCPVCHPVLNHARKTGFFVVCDKSRTASAVSSPLDA